MSEEITLHVDDGGVGGLPVVFLHSCAGNVSQWAAQLEHLRSVRRAVALDWRGHGRSGTPADGDFAIPTLAADVEEAVERLGLERFVLVGHSAGGLVSLQVAADHRERVAGLLLADPAGDIRQVPSEQTEPLLAGLASEAYADTIGEYWRFLLTGSDTEVQKRVWADLESTPKETVVGLFRAQLAYDPLPALRGYRGPALSVVTPFNDEPFALHNLYPDLPHTAFEGTGHWLQMDKPDEFNRVLDEFVERVEIQNH